jgi:hypothetical protein
LESVLPAFYRFETAQIVRVFERLLGLGHDNAEASERIAAALPLTAEGMDFADAPHLAGSAHCEALQQLRRRALRAPPPAAWQRDTGRGAHDTDASGQFTHQPEHPGRTRLLNRCPANRQSDQHLSWSGLALIVRASGSQGRRSGHSVPVW